MSSNVPSYRNIRLWQTSFKVTQYCSSCDHVEEKSITLFPLAVCRVDTEQMESDRKLMVAAAAAALLKRAETNSKSTQSEILARTVANCDFASQTEKIETKSAKVGTRVQTHSIDVQTKPKNRGIECASQVLSSKFYF